MPLYEYRCDACGHLFEQIQKFSDPPVDVCPKCGERQVEKLLSSPAIQFKGSGWYINDYARKGSGSDAAGKADGKDDKPAGTDAKAAGTDSKSSSSDSSSAASSDSSSTTPPTSSSKN